MREQVQQAFLESQQAMQEVTSRHEQLRKRCSLEREQFSNSLLITLDMLTSHKTHISETLGALQAHFADTLHSLNNDKPLAAVLQPSSLAHHAPSVAHETMGAPVAAAAATAPAAESAPDSGESDDNEISFKNVHLIVNQPRRETGDLREQLAPVDDEHSFVKKCESSTEADGDTDGDTMDLCKTTDLESAFSALDDLAAAQTPLSAQ
jgi:hypothetical protein